MMNTRGLFLHRFRMVGWVIFGFAFVHGLPILVNGVDHSLIRITALNNIINQVSIYQYDYTDEIIALGLIAGLILIAFSREKVEDEMISQLRLEALQWSVYANYLILAVAIVTIYDVAFLNVMIYNMFTVLLVFIARFRWLIYRNNRELAL